MFGRKVDKDNVEYSNVMLPGPGKKGILKKLDNDYYEILIGAFAAHGNGGWFYDLDSAVRYMNTNAEFLHLLNNRRLRSENGHPVREPGMKDLDWMQRVHEIKESNWSSHFRKIRLSHDTVKDKKGRYVVAIIAEATPCGAHADAMKRSFENPDEDINYSIRSFARRDFRTMRKHINKIITWDTVTDPGIAEISKYNTPSMESRSLDLENPGEVSRILDQYEFDLSGLRNQVTEDGSVSFESKGSAYTLIDSFYKDTKVTTSGIIVPKHLDW